MAVRTIDEIFRDFVIDGMPSSGPHHPYKPDIRDTLKKLLEGISTFPDNRVIRLNNANTGTANNIVVSASVAIPSAAFQVLYLLNVTEENTGPVTVSGAINRTLVTNTSEPVPAGYLKPGMAVLCIDTGSELRMLSYGDVESVIEDLLVQTKASEAAAELAKEQAQNAASDAVSQGSVPIYSTRNAVETLEIPAGINAFRTNGYAARGDGGAALYKKVDTEPSHAGKVRSADGAWWVLSSREIDVECFGAIGDGVADDTLAFDKAMSYFAAKGGGYLFATRVYNVPSGVELVSNVTLDGRGTGILNGLGVGAGDHNIRGEGISNVTLKGITSTVPRANLRMGGMAILFRESSNILIFDCRTDGGLAGIWFIHCSNVTVANNYIDTPKADGIHFGHGSSNCSAMNNTVVNTGDDALATTYYEGYPRPKNIKFIGNTVLGTIWGAGVAIYSADNVIISENLIMNTALYGIVTTNHDGADDPNVVTITGNNLSNLCRADKIPYSYWEGTNPADDPLITSSLHKSGMSIGGSRIRVKSNSVANVRSDSDDERHGMSIDGGFSIVIEGNSFFSINGYGIRSNKEGMGEIHILSNTFDYIDRICVNLTHNWTSGGVIVANNTFGYGQQVGDPYVVSIQNVTSGRRVHVAYNVSNNGRGIAASLNSPGFLSTGNLS